VPVTSTLNVHVAFAASVAFESLTLIPAAIEITPAGHVVDVFGVAATVTPEGNTSVSLTAVSATAPGAVFGIVTVNVDVPPAGIVDGANALLSVIAARSIVRFAVAGIEFETP